MDRTITLENHIVAYSVRFSRRARSLRLTVYRDGRFVVTLPRAVPESAAEKFIRQRSKWVITRLNYFKKHPPVKTIRLTKRDYAKQKERVRALAAERVEYFNRYYGYHWRRISIRNQKSRWGSCSSTKTLSFNFKIAYLPDDVRDYIIVHEICHLNQMNHSKKFWSLVGQTIPDYKSRIKKLKSVGVHLS